MPERIFTLEEANRLVRELDRHLARAQELTGAMRDARDQLVDLRIIWGDKIETAACPDHQEYARYRDRFSDLDAQLRTTMETVHGLGCVVKDVEQGLVDFPVRRGEEVVFLCWRKGEKAVRFWHSQTSGFAGRQPVDSL